MSTSALGYFVRGRAEELVGQAPVSTGRTTWLANNIAHLQDEETQFAANVCAPLGSYFTITTTPKASYSPTELAPMPAMIRARPDGSSTRLVVSISGYTSSAATATFYVTMRPKRIGSIVGTTPPITGSTVTATASTTSLTAVRLSFDPIYVTRLTDDWLERGAYGDDESGMRSPVKLYSAQVEVWAASSDIAAYPRIESVSVRELWG